MSLLILSPNIRWHSNASSSAMLEKYTAKHSQSLITKSAPVPGELSVSSREVGAAGMVLACMFVGKRDEDKKLLCLVSSEIEKVEKSSL